MNLEPAIPNPEYLIKSISEQGYSLEAALADIIDNCISAYADKVQILIDTDCEPFQLFLADNGCGMNIQTLRESMQFPSSSPEKNREFKDLGRFGLGMKTASFSQTRKFTVISKTKGSDKYHGFTWDVEILKQGNWCLVVNTDEEVDRLVKKHNSLNNQYLSKFKSFEPSTIIVWQGLYKFENYLDEKNKKTALNKEISKITTDHLEITFHRFMEKKDIPLKIRVNNHILKPFNPFPSDKKNLRNIEYRSRDFGNDNIRIEGFILPSSSIEEAKQGNSCWTTRYRSLMDMEGVYVYRSDRLIIVGGWNGLIKKTPRLQLARLRVDIGNNSDHLLHLNVAKSTVIIPHELKNAFEDYIECLKVEALKEFYNRGIKRFPEKSKSNFKLFERRSSNKDVLLELNEQYPLLRNLQEQLNKEQLASLNMLIRMINTTINKLRNTHSDSIFIESQSAFSTSDIEKNIKELQKLNFDNKQIKKMLIDELGFQANSIPDTILSLLKER